MAKQALELTDETRYAIAKMGTRIKKARLRRNIMAGELSGYVGISKGTLSAIEKGEPTVSVGAYAAVLSALGMVGDLDVVAKDREGRQNGREILLIERKRATSQLKNEVVKLVDCLPK